MFEGGSHFHITILETSQHGHSHVANQLGIFTKRFPKTRPSRIAAHVQHRGKVPRQATCINFFGRTLRHNTDKGSVPSGRQSQLLGTQRSTCRVRRTMYGIDAI